VITEIGGTVGDIESLPFLEAARQTRHDIGRDNCFFLHVSLVPYIGPSGELKTKPTQHSVAALRSIGIQPDAVVCRADRELPDSIKRKISLMCDVDVEAVVTAADAPSIYDIPKVLHREGLDAYVVRRLDLPFRDVDWTVWDDLLRRVHHPKEEVTVALVGKYIDLPDAYLSVGEALRAGGFAHEAKVHVRWIASDECATPAGAAKHLSEVDAVLVPGGFGIRGIEGKLGALKHARTHGIPTLGLCLGLQCMVIEYARNVAGLEKAASTEFDPDCPEPVISTMEEQKRFVEGAGDLGGTMRLGLYPAELAAGSVVREVYGTETIEERHRHRYEFNNAYREQLAAAGLVFSGTNTDLDLVEFVELPRDVHPYYVATQAHPELRSRPTRPHPLFVGLIGAAIERQKELRFPIDESGLRREVDDD
jgi:CTP synthase